MVGFFAPKDVLGVSMIFIAEFCNLLGLFVLVMTMIEIADIQIKHESRTITDNHESNVSLSTINDCDI
jgi:hypothetical protein